MITSETAEGSFRWVHWFTGLLILGSCASCAQGRKDTASTKYARTAEHRTILITSSDAGGLRFKVGDDLFEKQEALMQYLSKEAAAATDRGVSLSVQFAVQPGVTVKGSDLYEVKRATRKTGVTLWYWLLGDTPRGTYDKIDVELHGQDDSTWEYVLAGEEIADERVLAGQLRERARLSGEKKLAATLVVAKASRVSIGKLDKFKAACSDAEVVFYTYTRSMGSADSVGPKFGSGR